MLSGQCGAEVVADILFLQKREHIVETEDDWIYLGQTDKGYAINTYFLDHPEMILVHWRSKVPNLERNIP